MMDSPNPYNKGHESGGRRRTHTEEMKMRASAVLAVLLFAWSSGAQEYKHGPDSMEHPDVPKGKVTKHTWKSEIFPGTVRDYWVYVPAQYDANTPANVM